MTVSLEKEGASVAPQRSRLFPCLSLPIFSGRFRVSQDARRLQPAQTRRNRLILGLPPRSKQRVPCRSPSPMRVHLTFPWPEVAHFWINHWQRPIRNQPPCNWRWDCEAQSCAGKPLCPCKPLFVNKGKGSVDEVGHSRARWSIVL